MYTKSIELSGGKKIKVKKIKIKFSGMGGRFDPNNNFIVNILKKRYFVELSDNPDYLFYSVNSKDYLKYNCVRIFFTAENLVPDFNICDYGIGFHYLNFEDRYIRFPLYLVDGFTAYDGDDYASDLNRAMHKHEDAKMKLNDKEQFCSFVYSNSQAANCREIMFNELSKYKLVSSGGRYRNNIGGPVSNKLEFQKKHKFVIAFENTSTVGYTTEKIVNAFAANAIPIYWGNPEITKEFNPDSFINCHDYNLTSDGEIEVCDKIIKEIIRLDQDDQAYLKMLSTPAFSERNDIERMRKEFEVFLYNIFDQPLSHAFRRNRFYWGERYERKQRIGNEFYWLCRKGIPLRNAINKIFKRS